MMAIIIENNAKHNYKKLISQYLTPKYTLRMDLLLLCLYTIVCALTNRVTKQIYSLKYKRKKPYMSNEVNKVP